MRKRLQSVKFFPLLMCKSSSNYLNHEVLFILFNNKFYVSITNSRNYCLTSNVLLDGLDAIFFYKFSMFTIFTKQLFIPIPMNWFDYVNICLCYKYCFLLKVKSICFVSYCSKNFIYPTILNSMQNAFSFRYFIFKKKMLLHWLISQVFQIKISQFFNRTKL